MRASPLVHGRAQRSRARRVQQIPPSRHHAPVFENTDAAQLRQARTSEDGGSSS